MFRSRALCVTAKEFAAELADAFEVNAVVEFRKKYRECSLLTLDDIDSLAGRSAAQIELVYTLDALVDRGTQVVLTASVPPARLNQLHPTLVSRIGEGLAVGLAPPCVEVRTALWRRFAQLRQVELPEPVARILAEGVRGTVSDLQTAFAELEPAARLDRGHIDACWARKFIHSRSADRQPPLSAIATRTARHFTLHLADLRGPSRRRAIVTARNIAMYLARQLTDHSLDHIGTYFGGRDHTTVLHGCRKTENLLKSDPLTQQAIDRIRRKWDNAG